MGKVTTKCQHDFNPYKIQAKGNEVHKVYRCKCGTRLIKVYSYVKEYIEEGPEKD